MKSAMFKELEVQLLEQLKVLLNNHVIEIATQLLPEVEQGNIEYKFKLTNLNDELISHRVTQLNWRLNEGDDKAIYIIGVEDNGNPLGITQSELEESLSNIAKMATNVGCSIKLYKLFHGLEGFVVEVHLHRLQRRCINPIQIHIAMVGDFECGKSTLIGVMSTGQCDNGKGLARMQVFQHNHEVCSGMTSSISQHNLFFNSHGEILNTMKRQNEASTSLSATTTSTTTPVISPNTNTSATTVSSNMYLKATSSSSSSSSSASSSSSSIQQQYTDMATRVISFIDLAGHSKYLKTTLQGLLARDPDHCLLCISAKRGIQSMTSEHLGVAFALKLPLAIVITKMDTVTESQLTQLTSTLTRLLSNSQRQLVSVQDMIQLSSLIEKQQQQRQQNRSPRNNDSTIRLRHGFTANNTNATSNNATTTTTTTANVNVTTKAPVSTTVTSNPILIPIFLTSSVTGKGLPLLQSYLYHLSAHTGTPSSDSNSTSVSDTAYARVIGYFNRHQHHHHDHTEENTDLSSVTTNNQPDTSGTDHIPDFLNNYNKKRAKFNGYKKHLIKQKINGNHHHQMTYRGSSRGHRKHHPLPIHIPSINTMTTQVAVNTIEDTNDHTTTTMKSITNTERSITIPSQGQQQQQQQQQQQYINKRNSVDRLDMKCKIELSTLAQSSSSSSSSSSTALDDLLEDDDDDDNDNEKAEKQIQLHDETKQLYPLIQNSNESSIFPTPVSATVTSENPTTSHMITGKDDHSVTVQNEDTVLKSNTNLTVISQTTATPPFQHLKHPALDYNAHNLGITDVTPPSDRHHQLHSHTHTHIRKNEFVYLISLQRGELVTNHFYYFGPFSVKGDFYIIKINSIRVHNIPVQVATAGQTATIIITKQKVLYTQSSLQDSLSLNNQQKIVNNYGTDDIDNTFATMSIQNKDHDNDNKYISNPPPPMSSDAEDDKYTKELYTTITTTTNTLLKDDVESVISRPLLKRERSQTMPELSHMASISMSTHRHHHHSHDHHHHHSDYIPQKHSLDIDSEGNINDYYFGSTEVDEDDDVNDETIHMRQPIHTSTHHHSSSNDNIPIYSSNSPLIVDDDDTISDHYEFWHTLLKKRNVNGLVLLPYTSPNYHSPTPPPSTTTPTTSMTHKSISEDQKYVSSTLTKDTNANIHVPHSNPINTKITRQLSTYMYPRASWEFEAEILILNHPSKIGVNYEPVVHIGSIKQSARLISMRQIPSSTIHVIPMNHSNSNLSSSPSISSNTGPTRDNDPIINPMDNSQESSINPITSTTTITHDIPVHELVNGSKAICRFRFLYYPEYIVSGSALLLREGRTRGVGHVIQPLYDFTTTIHNNTTTTRRQQQQQQQQHISYQNI